MAKVDLQIIGYFSQKAPMSHCARQRRYYIDRERRARLADYGARLELGRSPAGDVFRKMLTQIPTVFGRLVYVAGLRDSAGLYSHRALNQIISDSEASQTLRHCHHQVFSQWISYTLAEQKADLDEYLASSKHPLNTLDLIFCRSLIPQAAHEVERLLYLTDLETLLELLRLERGGAFGIPKA